MIEDFRAISGDLELACDVCIVGCGAAGIALAREFDGCGLEVVVLESGGYAAEPETRELNRALITGLPYAGAWHGRARAFGGTTTLWGGQTLPLTPLDFEPRAWVRHSGWPISYEEVARYYPRALAFLGVDDLDYDQEILQRLHLDRPRMDSDVLRYHVSKWSPHPNLGTKYRDRIARSVNVRALLHANVTEIYVSPGGAVASLQFRTLEGKRGRVTPRTLILCAGGIETARLLLASPGPNGLGIGNDRDLVGRFLQDHPGGQIGTVHTHDSDAVQRAFNLAHYKGRKYSVRCSAASTFQSEARILNASVSLMFDTPENSGYASLKRAYNLFRERRLSRGFVREIMGAVTHPAEIIGPTVKYLWSRRTYAPNPSMRVMISTEQEPDPESRIVLSSERDKCGVPRVEIHWRLSELTRHTTVSLAEAFRQQFEHTGFGLIEFQSWVVDPEAEWRAHLGDHYHHIGTTRMHSSPEAGVVDTDARVHGVANLYVASSSVFPSGGHSNPTLTVLALALRLADHLKARLQ